MDGRLAGIDSPHAWNPKSSSQNGLNAAHK